MYTAGNWSCWPPLFGKYLYLSKLWNVFVYFEIYLSRNRNCSKVHWSKQVRCRRLATGRAGRLCLAANTPLPFLPIHLDFILHQDLPKCFIVVFLSLHFYISVPSSSYGVFINAMKIPLLRQFEKIIYFCGAYCVIGVSLWISICHSHDSLRLPDWHVHRPFIFLHSLLNGTTSVIH